MQLHKYQRSGKDITNVTMNVFSEKESIIAVALNSDKINKSNVITHFKNYFEEKSKETKSNIDKRDITELKRIFLPNILFFDEAVVEIEKINYEDDNILEPQTFEEFKNIYLQESILYLVTKICGISYFSNEQVKNK